MRQLIRSFFTRTAAIFFRRIEVVGLENVPGNGGVIFAVNHPNALIDPLVLLCFTPRDVSFLAKAPLFRYPLIGWFVRQFDSIPVYRKQDNAATANNAQTFAMARAVLARGGTIAIFPEGTTHSDPRLRELKTGAARIALGAAASGDTTLRIVPAGIYYTSKETFRSSALICFGEPVGVDRIELRDDGEPPSDAVQQLTSAIELALADVTLQADSHAALDLVARAEDVFSSAHPNALGWELELRRRFVKGYTYLREHSPERLELLASRITQFEAELEGVKLTPDELVAPNRARAGRLVRSTLILLLLLPFAAAGILVNYLTYRVIGFLAQKLARGEEEVIGTMKFVGALLLYPITWLLLMFVVEHYAGWRWAFAALAAMPVLGYAALRVSEEADRVIGRMRALARLRTKRNGYLALLTERDAIRAEIETIWDEMNATGHLTK